jgi:UDP-N-acetylglucosamine--N-acetylmuramyl-(pentapeptide) pyrophosphoryl-undecaprenol N-acetylglucosamine transferase
VEAFRIIRAVRPDCIVTFGGYVGLPIAIIGRILRVPVMLHEQTRVTGRANRIIRMLGAQMFTAFPGVLPGALYIGLPIRKEIFVPPSKISGDVPREPFLFISGGSTGAQSMNTALFPGIAKLLSDFSVVHQTGSVAFEEAKTFKMSLPSERQSRYVPVVSFSAADMAWLLHHARCFIGRSGANTVIETIVARLPSLFIPLPWASGDEQYWNARFVVDAGAGIVIRQTDVTPETIVSGVHAIESSEQTMRKKLDDLAQTIPIDAAGRMVDALEKMYKNS